MLFASGGTGSSLETMSRCILACTGPPPMGSSPGASFGVGVLIAATSSIHAPSSGGKARDEVNVVVRHLFYKPETKNPGRSGVFVIAAEQAQAAATPSIFFLRRATNPSKPSPASIMA